MGLSSLKNKYEGIGLVIGSETSTIGKAAEEALLKNFNVIKTSKEENKADRMYLDISSIESIQGFTQDFLKKYPGEKIKVLFLNAGNMITGNTLHRGNIFKRSNEGEKEINTHIYNLALVESLQNEGIIDGKTKIIYNASTQIFSPREGLEDYAKLKYIVSNILLSDESLDVTVLALSLVKGSNMTDAFQKMMEEKKWDMNEYVKKNMPEGQPTLDQVSQITEKIIEHKEETKGKIVCLDGGRVKSLGISIPSECIYFDEEANKFSSYENKEKNPENAILVRIQDHWAEGEQLSRNGQMKSFIMEGKKYIGIIGKNKQSEGDGDMPDDVKAWYGAVLEGYKMVSEHIYASYLPEKPPYEIKFPEALAHKHTNDADIFVIKWIDGLVSFDDINHYRAKVPDEHIEPINIFLDDRSDAIEKLSIKSGIRKHSKSRSKYRQFIVKMPYGDIIMNDDFGLRLNDNGAEEQLLKNGGYILGKKANEKPIFYLTDALVASIAKL